jgi:hypothetical protein
MLEDFIKDIQELIEYKKKYEDAMVARQRMSDALYELYLEKYNNQTFEERKEKYIKEQCKDCRSSWYGCKHDIIPDNVGMSIRSDRAWVPARVGCSEFNWS